MVWHVIIFEDTCSLLEKSVDMTNRVAQKLQIIKIIPPGSNIVNA